jgi:hypothetical protein
MERRMKRNRKSEYNEYVNAVIYYDGGNTFTTICKTRQEAETEAKAQWDRLTIEERQTRRIIACTAVKGIAWYKPTEIIYAEYGRK